MSNKEIIITGIRPTGNLTIGNYAGAVRPLIDLQSTHENVYVFVADLHALTDHEPSVVIAHRREVVKDYIALGVDPEKVCLYLQSDTEEFVSELTLRLSRLMSVAELIRVPTLKDKIKHNANAETANSFLALYPVMMAADIFLQKAKLVPVGEDQVAHLEIARKLGNRFNSLYGETLVIPKVFAVKPLRILSLKGEGKMSKSIPEGAIFLTDDPDQACNKIKRAQTAEAGIMTPSVESLFALAETISPNKECLEVFEGYRKSHMSGEAVMGKFKAELGEVTKQFIESFHTKRNAIDDSQIDSILARGAQKARANAQIVMDEVKSAMGL